MMEVSSSRSSTVSSVCRESFLQRILERLSSTQSLKLKAEDACPVAVVTLQRHLSDSQPPQDDSYCYDLTITDGVWRAKCYLHPTLNHMVHKNTLRTGTDISVTHCSFVYNERRLGHGYLCIDNLTCRSGTSAVWPPEKDASILPILLKHGMERSMSLQSDVPLQVNRKHYLPMWNNDDPEGDLWAYAPPSADTVLDVSKIALLCHLEAQFKHTSRPLPLLVRVIHKSRLRYYGKFGLKIDFPYQAYFEVADQSGTMSLVLWNDLCPEFYQRLNVGTVLYLQNYTLKQSYLNRSRPHMDHYKIKAFNSVEICLNPRNPASIITVISPKSVLPQWGLPEVLYQFTPRSELHQLSSSSACDIICLVTFVGRVERVKSKGNKGPEKYWTYRWIHAIDGTSDHPFILEVFSSSQPEIFGHICPMTYLVCTQMRLCEVEGGLPYLTSSCETQMYITGYHKGQPYVSDPKVKSFIQWTKTLKDNTILQKTAIGGYYCYPRAPKIFTQSVEDASVQVPLVAAADLMKELETLQYREHKRLAIQGQITAVRYLKQLTSTEESCQTEEQALVVSTQTRDEHVEDTSSAPEQAQSVAANLTPNSKRKRRLPARESQPSPDSVTPTKRSIIHEKKTGAPEGETNSASKEMDNIQSQESEAVSWESRSWMKQKEEVSEHLYRGVVFEDSIARRFTFDEKTALLHWSNLHPARWTSDRTTDPIPPVSCPGYYQITILGINKQLAVDAAYIPVVRPDEPRAAGLSLEPHGNTMLSCLSSGFLCPLSEDASQSMLPQPEEILATAGELEDLHVVCVLDLCHLRGDHVEVLINKVYKVTEVSLEWSQQ